MALLHQVLSPYSVLLELQEHCWANGNGCYPFLTRPRPSRHPSALIDYLMFTWSLTVSLAPWEVGVSNLGLAPELSVEHRTHLLWTQECIQPSSGFNLCTRSSGDSASSWTRWSDLAEVLSNNVAEMQSVGSYFNFHQLDVLTPLVAKQWMENIRLISSARSPRGQTQNGSQTKRIWSKDEYLMDNNQRNIENRFYCSRNALGREGEGKGEVKDAQETHKRWLTYLICMIPCFYYFWWCINDSLWCIFPRLCIFPSPHIADVPILWPRSWYLRSSACFFAHYWIGQWPYMLGLM